jgi:hypothetical protein
MAALAPQILQDLEPPAMARFDKATGLGRGVCRGWSPRASCGTDLAHGPGHRTGVPRIDEEHALCSIPEPPCPGFRGMGRRGKGNPRKRGGHLESWTQFGQLESSASGTTAQMGPSGGELQCWKSAWPTISALFGLSDHGIMILRGHSGLRDLVLISAAASLPS